MPNFRGRRFTNAHETLIWAARDAAQAQLYVQLRSAQGRQRRRADALRLVHSAVHRRGTAQRRRRQEAASDAKARSAFWRASSSRRRGRTIWCSTRFAAPARPARSRTGCAAASSASSARPDYAAAAQQRIAAIEPMAEPALAAFMTAREAPRVPFAALIERGLVTPGIKLVDAKRRHQALVRADGAIALGETVGSIHRIGALGAGARSLQRLDLLACRDAEGLTVIDALRAKVRAEMGAA